MRFVLISAETIQINRVLNHSHRKKREARIKRDVKRGIREPNEQDPFEIFITVTDIRYTYVSSLVT